MSLHNQTIQPDQPDDHLLPLPPRQHPPWPGVIRHGQPVQDGHQHDGCGGWDGLVQVEGGDLAGDEDKGLCWKEKPVLVGEGR